MSLEKQCKEVERKYSKYIRKILHDKEGETKEFDACMNFYLAISEIYFTTGFLAGFKERVKKSL